MVVLLHKKAIIVHAHVGNVFAIVERLLRPQDYPCAEACHRAAAATKKKLLVSDTHGMVRDRNVAQHEALRGMRYCVVQKAELTNAAYLSISHWTILTFLATVRF